MATNFRKQYHGRRWVARNSWSLLSTLLTMNGGRGTNICHSMILDEKLGLRMIHGKSPHLATMHTGYPKSNMVHKFRNGDLSCQNLPRPGRLILTLGRNLRLLIKYPLTSARLIINHFVTTVLMIKNIFQSELGMKSPRAAGFLFSKSQSKSSLCWNIKEVGRIVQESEANHFDEIEMEDKS